MLGEETAEMDRIPSGERNPVDTQIADLIFPIVVLSVYCWVYWHGPAPHFTITEIDSADIRFVRFLLRPRALAYKACPGSCHPTGRSYFSGDLRCAPRRTPFPCGNRRLQNRSQSDCRASRAAGIVSTAVHSPSRRNTFRCTPDRRYGSQTTAATDRAG